VSLFASCVIAACGAGRSAEDARRAITVGPVTLLAIGCEDSGIPPSWAASPSRSGIDLLPDLSDASIEETCARVSALRGQRVIVSIHWGSNWGHAIPHDHVRLARALIDAGADVIFGHSSHHPRPIELYRDRPILYGCGDLINDYEGISGYQTYRDDLRLLYFAMVEPGGGSLVQLRMVPMQARQLRLWHASGADVDHLLEVINQTSEDLGVRARAAADRTLLVTT
jgi:poly-gamma-glutamate synthesis protein (capsule biosynthesis protein)